MRRYAIPVLLAIIAIQAVFLTDLRRRGDELDALVASQRVMDDHDGALRVLFLWDDGSGALADLAAIHERARAWVAQEGVARGMDAETIARLQGVVEACMDEEIRLLAHRLLRSVPERLSRARRAQVLQALKHAVCQVLGQEGGEVFYQDLLSQRDRWTAEMVFPKPLR